jgi:RNA polymerase sigma-70 factor, ECF subfamily
MLNTVDTWREFSDQIRGWLFKQTNDDADSDDLLQEVFIKIHGSLHKLRDEEKVRAWIYQIARNTLNDYFAGKKMAPIANDLEGLESDSVEDIGFESDIRECLHPMINHLPEKYREALFLHEIKGLSQKEVAKQLGLSYPGAKSRIQRGREMLKGYFMDCCHYSLAEDGTLKGEHTRRENCTICFP